MRRWLVKTSTIVLMLACIASAAYAQQWTPGTQWAQGIRLRFFVGGDPGDTFAAIVYRGALQAEKDLGVKVEYVFSGWAVEKMTAQLREAIAVKPDGIAMMGHAGDDAMMPLAKQAAEAGIPMMWQNVDVPKVRAVHGGGYIGVLDMDTQGQALSKEALRTLKVPKGGDILVLGAWGDPGRYIREEGSAKAFEAAGYKVTRLKAPPQWSSDPNLGTPVITAALLNNKNIKLVVFPGGQLLGAAPMYMKAANKKPGDIFCIGYDTSPEVIKAFELGFVQLTSDQEPFLQGYLPILSLCLTLKYGFAPMVEDTGNGFVDVKNFKNVANLANKGLR
jgi:simple sugar transport system substrate-binding protein